MAIYYNISKNWMHKSGQACWYITYSPSTEKFKVILCYIMSSRVTWLHETVLHNQEEKADVRIVLHCEKYLLELFNFV